MIKKFQKMLQILRVTSVTDFIILINLIFFAFVSYQSGSLFSPQNSSIFLWGAKNSFKIMEGEYWRYFTAVFLHIGIIHFFVNNYSLKALGPHTEKIFGSRRFLMIYLVSGVAGNIASASYQPYPSAGASGALFGILGASFWFEWSLSRSANPLLAKTSMVKSFLPVIFINILLGLIVPMIDQAAHIGGLVSGVLLSEIFLDMNPNSVKRPKRLLGSFLILLFLGAILFGIFCSSQGIFLGL